MESSLTPSMPHELAENQSFLEEARKIIDSFDHIYMNGLTWRSIQKVPSKKRLPTREEALEASASYRVIDRSSCIMTEAGEVLIWYIRDGKSLCFMNASPEDLCSSTEIAFRDMTEKYPPRQPSQKDVRHGNDYKPIAKEWAEKKKHWGVYHLAWWTATGHPDKPQLSSDVVPDNRKHRGAAEKFLQTVAPESQSIGMWLKAVDEKQYDRYRGSYTRYASQGELGPIHQSNRSAFLGIAALVNKAVDPHTDKGDVRDGWVATTCVGNFEGGKSVFIGPNVIINQRPGDIVFARSALMPHWVTDITDGERYCLTFFTKKHVMDPPVYRLSCRWCRLPFVGIRSLDRHLKKVMNRQNEPTLGDRCHNIDEVRKALAWPKLFLTFQRIGTEIRERIEIQRYAEKKFQFGKEIEDLAREWMAEDS